MRKIQFRKPEYAGSLDSWIIERIDEQFITAQAHVALKTYENSELAHRGPLDNVLGLIAEYAFDGFLEKKIGLQQGTDYEWNKRKADYWEKGADRRPYDFKLKNGMTFELAAARPNHRFAILMNAPHKLESNYFVQVQIDWFRLQAPVYWNGRDTWVLFDASSKEALELSDEEIAKIQPVKKNEPIGHATIKGFDEIPIIIKEENGWRLKNEWPCTETAGYCKSLDALRPLADLKKIIEQALDLKPKEEYAQKHF